jgi:hypothetical protein
MCWKTILSRCRAVHGYCTATHICMSNNIAPSAFRQPIYFVWLSHLFHSIPCTLCKYVNRRTKKGSTAFLSFLSWPCLLCRIVDIDRNIFVIGYRYYCGHEACGKTYQSWLQAVLDVIPPVKNHILYGFQLYLIRSE